MEPQVCMQEILDSLFGDFLNFEETLERIENLAIWIFKDGYLPKNISLEQATFSWSSILLGANKYCIEYNDSGRSYLSQLRATINCVHRFPAEPCQRNIDLIFEALEQLEEREME